MKYAALYFLTLPVVILTAAGLSIGDSARGRRRSSILARTA